MFTLAIQAGKLLQRPHIPMLAEHNVRKGFFERAQFEAVRNRLPPTYQALVTLAYYTGWRVNSEILTLEWHQIDRAAGVIRLDPGTTKNDGGRTFKYAALDELSGRRGGPVGPPRGACAAGHHHAARVLSSPGAGDHARSGSDGGRRATAPVVRAASRMTSDAPLCGT